MASSCARLGRQHFHPSFARPQPRHASLLFTSRHVTESILQIDLRGLVEWTLWLFRATEYTGVKEHAIPWFRLLTIVQVQAEIQLHTGQMLLEVHRSLRPIRDGSSYIELGVF